MRARVGFDIGGGCRERDREGVGDGVVAVTEVLVEDLPADPGATDDVADGQLVDRTFVSQRERGVTQAGANPLGAGIGTVGACCHTGSLEHFVDS